MCASKLVNTRKVVKADLKECLDCKKVQKAQLLLGVPREDRFKCHRYYIVGADGSLQITPY